MNHVADSLGGWPIAAWVLVLAVAVLLGRYAFLYAGYRRFGAEGRLAERNLVEIASRLRGYAGSHLQTLPAQLEEVSPGRSHGVAYRPVPRLTLDERLVLLHDDRPTHKLLQFPQLRDGRGVVLCSGRLLVVSEEAFEKLLQADDVLRQRLGLEAGGGGGVVKCRPPEQA